MVLEGRPPMMTITPTAAVPVTAHPRRDLSALAALLFATSLQPSQRPSARLIRQAVEARLRADGGDLSPSVAAVAQEAGDQPELYVARIGWARRCVALAYPALLAFAA
jgi:hypothetical protein